ncbi:MAG TPA: alanine:cation symporter family protein [Bacillota bacterium]|nr:alanine:cation symporter family protein [Bacillota bacterium]
MQCHCDCPDWQWSGQNRAFFYAGATIIMAIRNGLQGAYSLMMAAFNKVVKVIYIIGIVYGAVGGLNTVWALAGFFMALLIIINLPIVIKLSGEVLKLTKEL